MPLDPASRSEPSRYDRLRQRFGERATGILAALALEAILLLLLLTIGQTGFQPAGSDEAMVSFDVRDRGAQAEPAAEPPQEPERAAATPVQAAPPVSSPPSQAPVDATMPRPPAVVIPRAAPPAGFRLDDLPRRRPDRPASAAPAQSAVGPAAPSTAGDSEIVGTAPDGEPLYAARWFREPTQAELAGYLQTAQPGSWALIACKTAPDWRVEDCVGLEEFPSNSNIQRAVLAASWQFQVRPPRRGNRSLVGAWVRILIQYGRG